MLFHKFDTWDFQLYNTFFPINFDILASMCLMTPHMKILMFSSRGGQMVWFLLNQIEKIWFSSIQFKLNGLRIYESIGLCTNWSVQFNLIIKYFNLKCKIKFQFQNPKITIVSLSLTSLPPSPHDTFILWKSKKQPCFKAK